MLKVVVVGELLELECEERTGERGDASLRGGREGCARVRRRATQRRQGRRVRSVCVRGGHARAESTCRRHERHQRPAVATEPREVATSSFIPLSFSLFVGELCVSGVEASSVRIELCKFPDCHVRWL